MLPTSILATGLPMHIPDGFLSLPVLAFCWTLTAFLVGMALRRTQETLGEQQVPFIGVMAATIFAAQMLNFPIVGGTSGHLIGGALAAILLGPWAATLVMTSVLTLQAIVFLDGGLLALGANILIMGVLCPWIGYAVYRLLIRVHEDLAVFVASWASVVVAAAAVSVGLWLSGTVALPLVLRAMIGIHALIGVGEGILTLAILRFLARVEPQARLSPPEPETTHPFATTWRVGLVLALVLALLSPLASSWPDGLERVAEDLDFLHRARPLAHALFADYTVPWIPAPALSVMVAGVVGVLGAFALGYVLARALAQSHSG